MLLRVLEKLLLLDLNYLVNHLILTFIVMGFMMYAWHILKEKNYKGVWGFVVMWVFLYAVLDVMALTKWIFFTEGFMLEFVVWQMLVIVLLHRTRFEKFGLIFNLGFFFFMSWMVTP